MAAVHRPFSEVRVVVSGPVLALGDIISTQTLHFVI
jgi:hypothetical protein